jgi:hypothetical protein
VPPKLQPLAKTTAPLRDFQVALDAQLLNASIFDEYNQDIDNPP